MFQVIVCVALIVSNCFAAEKLNNSSYSAVSSKAIVATQDKYATQVGINILKNGGNAIDAAVAIGYTMAVTHPQAGNLAGGGFMMIYSVKDKKTYALDYREVAPFKATETMFLDENNNVDTQKSRFSILSTGVPGTPAGLAAAYERFGSLSFVDLINPAIKLAKDGFKVTQEFSDTLKYFESHLRKHKSTEKIFYKGNNFYEKGDVLKQVDLAKTLTRIKTKGITDFYNGELARDFINFMQENGSIMSLDDLSHYQAVFREPIVGTYKGYKVVSMPPPSSGGIALIETLNILESLKLDKLVHNSPDYIQLISEALKFTYYDRATYLGDSDFVQIPYKTLLSKAYAKKIASKISTKNIINADQVGILSSTYFNESNDTTHFVVADSFGNVVSNTYTLNFNFGNGQVVEGLGLFLNNEMDDFSAKPGVANAYGLIGNEKNKIEPQKRMLSSMTPTIVFNKDVPFIVTGSPGGSRIITTVLQVILNIIDHNMSIENAVNKPRFHHQWKPDYIRVEADLDKSVTDQLAKRGYTTKVKRNMGSAQSILILDTKMVGAIDSRTSDSKVLGL